MDIQTTNLINQIKLTEVEKQNNFLVQLLCKRNIQIETHPDNVLFFKKKKRKEKIL